MTKYLFPNFVYNFHWHLDYSFVHTVYDITALTPNPLVAGSNLTSGIDVAFSVYVLFVVV